MTQPAAKARDKIQSLLESIIEHEVKMEVAQAVDVKFGSALQTNLAHWQKEIAAFWREIEKTNRTPSRRRGQFFSDDQISQWKEELTDRGFNLAVNRLMEYLRDQGIEGDARVLKKMVEEWYD